MDPLKRVFLIVLDSFGIGEAPDAAAFGDEGSNTLAAVAQSPFFSMPNLGRAGLFHIDGVACRPREPGPTGAFARMREASQGKDTTIGHWEIAGLVSERPLPVYPNGFPPQVVEEFQQQTGRGVLCNKPYSGTQVIRDYAAATWKPGILSSTPPPTACSRWRPTNPSSRRRSCTGTAAWPAPSSPGSTAWAG